MKSFFRWCCMRVKLCRRGKVCNSFDFTSSSFVHGVNFSSYQVLFAFVKSILVALVKTFSETSCLRFLRDLMEFGLSLTDKIYGKEVFKFYLKCLFTIITVRSCQPILINSGYFMNFAYTMHLTIKNTILVQKC